MHVNPKIRVRNPENSSKASIVLASFCSSRHSPLTTHLHSNIVCVVFIDQHGLRSSYHTPILPCYYKVSRRGRDLRSGERKACSMQVSRGWNQNMIATVFYCFLLKHEFYLKSWCEYQKFDDTLIYPWAHGGTETHQYSAAIKNTIKAKVSKVLLGIEATAAYTG